MKKILPILVIALCLSSMPAHAGVLKGLVKVAKIAIKTPVVLTKASIDWTLTAPIAFTALVIMHAAKK